MAESKLKQAYAHCRSIAESHYENFPVGSWMVPRKVRPYFHALYAFARTADDFADEESNETVARKNLVHWRQKLEEGPREKEEELIFLALWDAIDTLKLPRQLLLDMIEAFLQDLTTKRYLTRDRLLGYCRNSANPVGRLVLALFGESNDRNCHWSDAICTALQLANFWQDVVLDLHKNRIYIPQEDMTQFNYSEQDLYGFVFDQRWKDLMASEVDYTRSLFLEGKHLLREVANARLRTELKMIWLGGMAILEKLEAIEYNVFENRPSLSSQDRWRILFQAVFQRV